MKTERIVLSAERSVTLDLFLQEVGGEFRHITKRPAVLVIPGGGYAMCSDREADPVALAYAKAGYQAFILRYSVGKDVVWPRPLQDYEDAMTLIRENAEAWHIYADKIAVIGFSAGGHLAAAAATLAENRPNAAILGYAVLEGETARECLSSVPDLVSAVDEKTCPCFLFATRTDNIVPISNTLNFSRALDAAGIGFESHVYAFGPHGFSVCDPSILDPGTQICPRAARWVEDSIAWLGDIFGEFGENGMTPPRCGKKVNDDRAKFLSVDCTMGHLMANSAARAILAPMMEAARERMAEKYGDRAEIGASSATAAGLGGKMTLRSALAYSNTPAEVVAQLDAALRKIPNHI